MSNKILSYEKYYYILQNKFVRFIFKGLNVEILVFTLKK